MRNENRDQIIDTTNAREVQELNHNEYISITRGERGEGEVGKILERGLLYIHKPGEGMHRGLTPGGVTISSIGIGGT